MTPTPDPRDDPTNGPPDPSPDASTADRRSRLAKAGSAAALIVALAVPAGWAGAPAAAQDSSTATTQTEGDAPGTDPSGTDAPTRTSSSGRSTRAGATSGDERQARRAARRAERESIVADKLGVTPDELRASRLTVLTERLDERVEAGTISQARADEILDAARNGTLRDLHQDLRRERRAERTRHNSGG